MVFKARQRFGQYRIQGRLASGGFAEVYKAYDTIEGIQVALKIPHAHLVDKETLERFRQEVRLAASLDHPNILPIKTAGMIEGHFTIVTPMGIENLADRMTRRIGRRTVLLFARQLLEALACAHRRRVIHCDVKPENLILFPENRIRLADFGLARVAFRSMVASGSGTVGYLAPEQALGKPTLRSDVFAAGLVLYRMMSGRLPEWPFRWPYPGLARARAGYHADLIELVRKATQVEEARRFPNSVAMLQAFERIQSRALLPRTPKKRKAKKNGADWRELRLRQFRREHGRVLHARDVCANCDGPVSEEMKVCPWCAKERRVRRDGTRFPATCPRCSRGVKLDWKYCPWCYGAAVGPLSERSYSDARYAHRCGNRRCPRQDLLPFMRYCPWCRTKVVRKWKIEGNRERCKRCGWGVLGEYWNACPWCGKHVAKT